ncbi:MAG TPA: NAD(P)-dependent oxidoreductase [Saprospiraceae bacterium]|nr:NAD(P)-dependent oxidoreductase [Saprospiraceae bacterium]
MKKVLITDDVHPDLIHKFENISYKVDYYPEISLEEVKSIIHDYEGLIVNSKILVDKDFIDRAHSLKFIGRLGSGMEIIDQTYAKQKGIGVFSSPEGNRNAVAEHAMAMLLALGNNIIKADQEVRKFIWNRQENRGFELEGKTIGIIGFGHTGRTFAQKLQGWNVNILVYDKYLTGFSDHSFNVYESSKETVLEKSNIISLHLPLTEETFHYVDHEMLNKMKRRSVLINTSRGKIVDTLALIEVLKSGHLKGACLDVFENEKPENYNTQEKKVYEELLKLKNIIVTPHIAGWTLESKEKLSKILFEKILLFLS